MPRREKTYNYIYRITCLKNQKYYIGMHSTDDLDDGYMGSGRNIRNSIKKHGKDSHIKEILEYFDSRKDLRNREIELVNLDLLKDSSCLNISLGGGDFDPDLISGKKHMEISILGGIASRNKFINDPEYSKSQREKSSKVMKKNHESEKIRYDTFTGKKHSIESRKKIGEKNSINQRGEKNSQYGTIWITNGIENKKIRKDSAIPEE